MKRSIKRLICLAMSLCITAAMALTVSASDWRNICETTPPAGVNYGGYVMVDTNYQGVPYLYAQAYTVCNTATQVTAYVYMIYNTVPRSDSDAGSTAACAELGPYTPYEYSYIGPNVQNCSCSNNVSF